MEPLRWVCTGKSKRRRCEPLWSSLGNNHSLEDWRIDGVLKWVRITNVYASVRVALHSPPDLMGCG